MRETGPEPQGGTHGQRITQLVRCSHSFCRRPFGFCRASSRHRPTGHATCQISSAPDVPHDVPAGPGATIQELAIFAWQEFIALNWVAMDPGTTGKRGLPAPFTDPNTGFLDIAPDASGNFPLVVWQTYRHKNELFPSDGTTDTSFDSSMPTYNYQTQPHVPRQSGPDPELQSLQQSRRDEPDWPGQHVCTLHI